MIECITQQRIFAQQCRQGLTAAPFLFDADFAYLFALLLFILFDHSETPYSIVRTLKMG